MLCCLGGVPVKYSPVETDYPGLRRTVIDNNDSQPLLVKTKGNALVAFDPSKHKQIVSVTVPKGVCPGQTIHISAPDGSDQKMAAVVPDGMSPGSTFLVEYSGIPAPTEGNQEMPLSSNVSTTATALSESAVNGHTEASSTANQKEPSNALAQSQRREEKNEKRIINDPLASVAPMVAGGALLGVAGMMMVGAAEQGATHEGGVELS